MKPYLQIRNMHEHACFFPPPTPPAKEGELFGPQVDGHECSRDYVAECGRPPTSGPQ
jgi:hypothetical protein